MQRGDPSLTIWEYSSEFGSVVSKYYFATAKLMMATVQVDEESAVKMVSGVEIPAYWAV